MNTASTRRNPVDVDLHHFATGKHPLQLTLGRRVGAWVAKLGGDHRSVAYVEVDVARGEFIVGIPLAHLGGGLEHDHFELSALGIGGGAQDVQMALGHRVIEGLGVRVIAGDDHSRSGKTRVEVGVPVGDVFALHTR